MAHRGRNNPAPMKHHWLPTLYSLRTLQELLMSQYRPACRTGWKHVTLVRERTHGLLRWWCAHEAVALTPLCSSAWIFPGHKSVSESSGCSLSGKTFAPPLLLQSLFMPMELTLGSPHLIYIPGKEQDFTPPNNSPCLPRLKTTAYKSPSYISPSTTNIKQAFIIVSPYLTPLALWSLKWNYVLYTVNPWRSFL